VSIGGSGVTFFSFSFLYNRGYGGKPFLFVFVSSQGREGEGEGETGSNFRSPPDPPYGMHEQAEKIFFVNLGFLLDKTMRI